jgi:PmbA protein
MTQSLDDLTAQLLQAARKAGAESADALAVAGESLSVELHNTALDHAERAEGIDLGLRVLIGRRQACVSASDSRPETIAALAERAVAMAREAPEDPWAGLADAAELAAGWDLAALDLDDPADPPEPDALEAAGLEAAKVALGIAGVSQVQAGGSWGRTRLHLAATNGFAGGYARTSTSLYCVAIAGEGQGMERDHAAESRAHRSDMPGAEEIGRRAAERAVAMKGARKPPTGAFPVLYDERVASGLIGHLLSAVNGTAVARGASWLKDALGERVLPAGIDLVEDPGRPRGSASRPFDGEGLPAARRVIIRDGVLTGWVLDLSTGRKLGMPSTGNAMRGTGAPPSPGVGNLTMTQGMASREDLIREMGRGLLVTSLIGSTINPTTGTYSRGASGFWIEGGEIAGPVNECTIAGNLRDMLRGLRPASDALAHRSRIVPSLLVEGLTLAGA